jgi:molybdopterin-guanine dinucleotide biosynthesis protein A
MATPSFSAALLAGGQSTRMGRDKALLPAPGSPLLLWQRQLRLLEELEPDEILWSGPARNGIPGHVRVIADAVADAGPLAGIAACLEAARHDRLVVLAIDLPQMSAAYLQRLVAQSSSERGAVVRHGAYFEPLAAVYPKKIAPLALEHLQQGRRALQDLIHEALGRGWFEAVTLDDADVALFRNVNTPSDLADAS